MNVNFIGVVGQNMAKTLHINVVKSFSFDQSGPIAQIGNIAQMGNVMPN